MGNVGENMFCIIMALILDLIIGDPYCFPHPVKLMGRLISLEEACIRHVFKTRTGLRQAGFIIALFNILLAFLVPYLLLALIRGYKTIYIVINTCLIYSCIAARCLHKEAMKVYRAINQGLEEARTKLSYIVGRDTDNLTKEEIIKATVETIAENTSDGVIAPLLYIMTLGAPGGLMYKMVNTMDSILGYKNEKYIDLGYFPAKVDDVFNYIPARLTGVLMCISSLFRFDGREGLRIMIRDRKNHKSPNCAYPEGAAAGLLNIQLGGNNHYYGQLIEKPTIGDQGKMISINDIKKTIEIMYRSEFLLILLYGLIFYVLRGR